MLSDEVLEKVIKVLTDRIEEANTYTLIKIGEAIKKIGTLSATGTYQLANMLKYGGDYDKITRKLAEITNLNVRDIKKIFEEVARSDYEFARQFYEFRHKKFIPYEENMALKLQVEALANITAKEYVNMANTLAFTRFKDGKYISTPLSQAYNEAIDRAVLSISQGKSTFQQEMYDIIKDFSASGIRTVDYASGNSTRLDSALRMHMRGALRNLHNETQQIIGQEFNADGVEISVHLNPAPDHAFVQGKQFSNEEFEKFQNDLDSVSYDGTYFTADFEGHDRRAISEYNCYHYVFSIILGVSKPEYTDKELKQIMKTNEDGFMLNGRHYTNYQGTQMQRRLETSIRRAKDEQKMARASGIPEEVSNAQKRITILTRKYKELSKASNLPTRLDKARVSGYKRIKVA